MNEPVLQVAAKAVIVNGDGQVLILRESSTHATNTKAGRYHVPGGRLNSGETFIDGLKREVAEETGLSIKIGHPILVGEWRPIILGVPHQIVGIFIACRLRGSARFRLSEEHDAAVWINLKDRKKYDIVDPDCDAIQAFCSSSTL